MMLELICFCKVPESEAESGSSHGGDRSRRKGERGSLYQKQETETNQVDDTSQVTNSYGKSTNRGALRSAIQSRELWSTAR
jgi:hypothetical protein